MRNSELSEGYAAFASRVTRALGICGCGEQLTIDGRCEGCELTAQLEASIVAAQRAGEVAAVERRASGTACMRCEGSGYELSFGAPGNYETCARCGGTGER